MNFGEEIIMQKNKFRRGLVIGIILMFVGASFVPGISGSIRELSNVVDMYIIEKTIEQECFLGYSPEVEWNKTFGGTNHDVGNSVQQTTDGGYIITGFTNSFGAFGVWLIKTDSNGDEEWNKTFGGLFLWGYSVQQTIDGGYIITGYTEYLYVWLIKTDSNGDEEWNKTFGGDLPNAFSVQQTTDEGYIITGCKGQDDDFDVWLIKTDSNGDEEWNKTFGGPYWDNGYSVQQTTDEGYIITGYTNYVFMHSERTDVWLIKTDSNGDEEWNKTFDNTCLDYGMSVQQTTDEGYIITGTTCLCENGCREVWLIKTDSNGDEEWNKTFGGTDDDYGRSVQQTTDGGYIITGDTESYGAGDNDVWLIKTDTNGNELWNKTIGGTNIDYGMSVQQTTDGGYIITGFTYSYGAGSGDLWLIKIAPAVAFEPMFILGRVNNVTKEDEIITFNAKRIMVVNFSPFGLHIFKEDELITIQKDYMGLVFARFVLALCDGSINT